MRLTPLPVFGAMFCSMEPEIENMMTKRHEKKLKGKRSRNFSGLKNKTIYKIRIMLEK